MMIGKEASGLIRIVSHIIETREEQRLISPSWVATETMVVLGATELRKTYPDVYIGCHLQVRQIARGQLRQRWENPETDDDEHPLFPGLQRRYPVQRPAGEEPEYIKLENLSRPDAIYNIERLRLEARSKLEHADALQSWLVHRLDAAGA
jgi:hypothetical protein